MTETITAGAHGAPERINLDQYKQAIRTAPELLYHLAHLVVPGAYSDGQPTAKDRQSAPGRITPLDELEAIFSWLWREAGAWAGRAALDAGPIGHMVRRDDNLRIIGTRWIVTDQGGADGLYRDACTLVGVIMHAWPTIESWYAVNDPAGKAAAHQWITDVDQSLLRPLARWPMTARTPVPERARQCEICGNAGIFTAFVNTKTGTIMCARCEAVTVPEAWLPVKDVAEILGVTERAVRGWIAAGLPSKKEPLKGRFVELGAARAERQYREARKEMNLKNNRRSSAPI